MSDVSTRDRKEFQLLFVVESGTDVRMVDGLAERTSLTVVGREISGGRIISRDPKQEMELICPSG